MLSNATTEEHGPGLVLTTPHPTPHLALEVTLLTTMVCVCSPDVQALCCQGQMAASFTKSLSLPIYKVGLITTFLLLTSTKGFTDSTPQ